MIFIVGLLTGLVLGFILGVFRTLKSLKNRTLKNAKKFVGAV